MLQEAWLGFKDFDFKENTIDINYAITKEERLKNYSKEAVAELIKWAFSLKLIMQISVQCLLGNIYSINLVTKLNFCNTSKNDVMLY